MGQVLVKQCSQTVADVSAACPNCIGPPNGMMQQRLQELVNEVDEARQENRRLGSQAQRLRLQMKDQMAPISEAGPNDRYRPQADQHMYEELLQMKRQLWDLQ